LIKRLTEVGDMPPRYSQAAFSFSAPRLEVPSGPLGTGGWLIVLAFMYVIAPTRSVARCVDTDEQKEPNCSIIRREHWCRNRQPSIFQRIEGAKRPTSLVLAMVARRYSSRTHQASMLSRL